MTRTRLRATGIALVAALGAAVLGACSQPAAEAPAATGQAAPGVDVPAAVAEAGALEMAAFLEYPPYRYVDDAGNPAGIEVQMATAIAAKMGVEPVFHDMEFAAVIPAISTGRYDFALGAFQETAERREVVDILDYNRSALGLQVLAGNPKGVSPADICGVSFGHVTGSAQADMFQGLVDGCAAAGRPAPTEMLFQDVATQLQGLRGGRFDALLQPPPVGLSLAATPGSGFAMLPGLVEEIPAASAGWVFPKGDTEMERAVLQSIQSLIDDGTWGRILADGGLTETALVPPTLNDQPVPAALLEGSA
jgi:polar amino acid transport system substrate-binding protein